MTSIEWLENRIKVLIPEDIGSQLMFKSNIAKAKEMHKSEIIKANRDGVDMAVDKKPFIMGEQYYQEMFELEQQLDIPSHMRWHNRQEPKQETSLEEAAGWLNKKFNGKGVEVKIIDWGKNEMYNYNPTKLLEEYSKWQEENSKSLSDKWKEYQDWLNETPEISDEEIEKAARNYDNSVIYGPPLLHFEQGAFWYREQLKNKKD